MSITYAIIAKLDLFKCRQLDLESLQLLRDVFSYTFPESIEHASLAEEDRLALVKQIFIADMRSNLGDRLFGGDALS